MFRVRCRLENGDRILDFFLGPIQHSTIHILARNSVKMKVNFYDSTIERIVL